MEPIGEIGSNFSLQLSSQTQFAKISNKKVIAENQCEKHKLVFKFKERNYHITILETIAVVICLKLWGSNFKGKKIQTICDNKSICQVIHSGKTRVEILQDCLREI